jgi:hypothetical protein
VASPRSAGRGAPPIRVEPEKAIVEEQERRPAVLGGQEVQLRELEREDRRPLLAARSEPGHLVRRG